jgi:hypothetical protein
MKSVSAALILGLVFSGFCFAQTQTGNASYNTSKKGLTISHSSMSFGARVRVINLRNNQEIIAAVDGRIPASDPRIADISAEAGDAIGMSRSGYTEVRLEQLAHLSPAESPSASAAAGSSGGGAATAATATTALSVPPPPGSGPGSPGPENPPAQAAPGGFPLQPQYVIAAGQGNCFRPLCIAILVLLIVIVLLLTGIVIWLLSLGRVAWWFRRHSSWVRRHRRSITNRRNLF